MDTARQLRGSERNVAPGLNRRSFLQVLGGGSALALLSACSGIAPAAPAGGGTANSSASSGTAGATSGNAYPNYYPVTSGAQPDIPAAGPQYEVGFVNYPKNPPKSWTKSPPGLGSKIVSYVNAGAPLPPTPMDQNPAWQEVNKELNATVDFQILSQTDYVTKLPTMMAGNDLTDFILIGKNVGNLTAFLKAKAADLTPYLGGDAV